MRYAKDLKDTNIMLKELFDFKDSFLKNDLDLRGHKIINTAPGSSARDVITFDQLPVIPEPPKEQDKFYTIVFSTTGPISVGDKISAPFIVGKGREGIPYAVQVASTVAPTTGFLAVNLTINGKQLLTTDLIQNNTTNGPVASSSFVAGAGSEGGFFKLGYQVVVLPTCSAANGASLVTIQLIVKRVKQSLVGK